MLNKKDRHSSNPQTSLLSHHGRSSSSFHSYAVAQRTREIGIRVALGAKKSELVWMFVRSALVLAGIGTAVGLGAAAALMRLMRTLLFGISPLDPVTFTAVPVALAAAAALASYLPARRTTAIDPVEALRAE